MKIRNITIFLILIFMILLGVLLKNSIRNNSDFESKLKNQWALLNSGQEIKGKSGQAGIDLNATKAWKITSGNNKVIVGILDTGIEISNPKISNSIFVNKKEIVNNDIDDDNNGYVDDVNGWNFYNNNNSLYDYYLSDYNGTFIASLIAGAHNDDNKVWGIAPDVKILPLKFMSGSSGNIDNAIKAIDYAYSLGAKIINCSWDSTEYNISLYKAMKKYNDVLFITTAGKRMTNINKSPVYPCRFDLDNIICVSAVDNKGQLYEYSGYGAKNVVAAPGQNILGMLPESDYLYADGTSFATAYVSGIAGLVKSQKLDISVTELADILKSSYHPIDPKNGFFNGVIDARIALEKVYETN